MNEKPAVPRPAVAVPSPQYTWGEGLGTALALAQRCMAELRTLARTPGPEGRRGLAGDKGDKGDRGEGGKAGSAGVPGRDGLDGKDGKQGARGERGEQGPEGPAGPPGGIGEKGDPGEPAYPGRACGLWNETESYRAMDVVACNGSEWRAVYDNPGPLPGDGWRQGAKGARGKPGEKGERGLPGPEGRGIVDVSVAEDGQTLMIKFSDGAQRAIPLVTR